MSKFHNFIIFLSISISLRIVDRLEILTEGLIISLSISISLGIVKGLGIVTTKLAPSYMNSL